MPKKSVEFEVFDTLKPKRKKETVVIETSPAKKHYTKFIFIILIVVLLLAIIIVLAYLGYDYLKNLPPAANGTEQNEPYFNDTTPVNDSGIDDTSKPTNYCGNGTCDKGENYTNCPKDCKKPTEPGGPGGPDSSCTPNCTGKQCGGDGCGGSCGTCLTGQYCSSMGQCITSPYKWEKGPSSDPDFFPIGVWLQAPSNIDEFKNIGINIFVGLWNPVDEPQLAAFKKKDMPVFPSQNSVGLTSQNSSVIEGWLSMDEPDNAQPDGGGGWLPCIDPLIIQQKYNELKSNDSTRPVYLNFGRGVSDENWVGRGTCTGRLDMYPEYIKGADIISYDIYPVTSGKPISYVARGVERLVNWSNGTKIVWNIIETTHIQNATARPSAEQVKSEVWMSIIHGSMGITYFVHEWQPSFREDGIFRYPEIVGNVTLINQRITSLAPVLNSPTLVGRDSVVTNDTGVKIKTMLKEYGDSTYLFAIAMGSRSVIANFTINNIATGTGEVIDENRNINVVGNKFQDTFRKPYEVHIYKISELIVNQCNNGIKDGTETDVDCGGSCAKCANGKACLVASDCQSNLCIDGICQTSSVTCLPSNNCFSVSVTGAGSHDGTLGNEMTLNEAKSYANSHIQDTLLFMLQDGKYGSVLFDGNSRTAPVTYKSVNKRGAVFDRLNIGKTGSIISQKLTVDGVSIIVDPAVKPTPTGDFIGGYYFGTIDNSADVTITNSYFKGFNKYVVDGLHLTNTYNVKLLNNEVKTFSGNFPMVATSNSTYVINNTLSDISMGSIMRFVDMGCNNLIMKENRIFDCNEDRTDSYFPYLIADDISKYHMGSIFSMRADDYVLDGNIVHDCHIAQNLMNYREVGNFSNITMQNNVFYDTANTRVLFLAPTLERPVIIRNNTFIGYSNMNVTSLAYQIVQRYKSNFEVQIVNNGEGFYFYNNIITGYWPLPGITIQQDNNILNSYDGNGQYERLGQNTIFAVWESPSLHGYPNFFEDIYFRGATSEYSYSTNGFTSFFAKASLFLMDIDWAGIGTYDAGAFVKYDPNGKYYRSLQNTNHNHIPPDSPDWWVEDTPSSFWDADVGRYDLDFHPLINSVVCNGGYLYGKRLITSSVKGTPSAGALPCVCTQNSQCVEVYGTGSTCNLQTKKCEGGMPNLPAPESKSFFSRLLELLKRLFS